MAAHKKVWDMDAVSKAASKQVNALVKSGQRATVETVIAAMQADGSDIAPTRLALLLKELSDTNQLGGFYLRRGHGFVHEDDVPRPTKKRTRKSSTKKASSKKSNRVVTPDAIADQIRAEERAKAEEEYRNQVRAEERARLGLTG